MTLHQNIPYAVSFFLWMLQHNTVEKDKSILMNSSHKGPSGSDDQPQQAANTCNTVLAVNKYTCKHQTKD